MARLLAQGEARQMALPGRRAAELVGAASGAEGCSVRLVEIDPLPPGAPERGPHVHLGFEECIHVLAGRGVTRTPGAALAIGPGDTLLVPPGELHATSAAGPGVLRLICFFPVADIRPATREFASWEEALRNA